MLQLARPGGAEAASDDTQMQMATHPGKKHALGTAAVWSGMHGMARRAARGQSTQLATKPQPKGAWCW